MRTASSAALLISWGVSVYFVPYLGARLLHTRVKAHNPDGSISTEPHETFDSPFYERFRRVIAWCLSHRWWTIGATLATFVLGLVGMGLVQQQFFPDSSRPEIMVDLWLPEGATMKQSEDAAKRFEAIGFDVQTIEGHDMDVIYAAFERAKKAGSGKPQLIIAKTLIGKGIPEVEGTQKAHGEGGVGSSPGGPVPGTPSRSVNERRHKRLATYRRRRGSAGL